MNALPTPDQFAGCLIGQCLGDALGFPVEGYPPEHCAAYVAEILDRGRAGSLGRGSFPFGQYTDDSQLARELLQSYVARGAFDPADYAARIGRLFAEDRVVGRGQATAAAARRIAAGVPWDEAGEPPPSAGNGSAMRAGPVGLIAWSDAAERIRIAADQGRITHQDPRCSAGAAAVAGAVALALRPGPLDPVSFVTQLETWVGPLDPSVGAAIGRLREWWPLPPAEAAPLIAACGADPALVGGWRGISPFVTGSVLWSLYSFLRTPEDYWTTIRTAIAVGGDVDTTAAMAGAIAGAHVGLAGLPVELARRVNDRETWTFDELVALAHETHRLATR